MKLLFITESFYYNPSPNGNCVMKIAQCLIDRGHEVSVLALENQLVNETESVGAIKVYRAKTYAEWKLMYTKSVPKLLARILQRLVRFGKRMLNPLHPFRSPGVLMSLYSKAKRIIHSEQIDVVIGVHRDFETALCGALLKKQFPQIKNVLYTLVALSRGVCSNHAISLEKHKKKCQKWEMYFAKQYDYLCPMISHKPIFQREELEQYKNKIYYVDIPNLDTGWLSNIDEKMQQDEEISFVYTGMMSETSGDCSFFLNLIPLILKERRVRFDIYGGISESISEKLDETELLNRVIFYHGRVTQDELVTIRKNADIFVNFGNEHECGIPCKIFEYMSTGKRIISFKKIANDASEPYLVRYGNALVLQEDYSKGEEYSKQILNFIQRNNDVQITAADLLDKFRLNTPECFADFLEDIQ